MIGDQEVTVQSDQDYHVVLAGCIDIRQWAIVKAFVQQAGLVNGRLHPLSRTFGGGLVFSPIVPGAVRHHYLAALRLAVEHHGVDRVVLVSHEDCGMCQLYAPESANDATYHTQLLGHSCTWLREQLPASVDLHGFLCVRKERSIFAENLIRVYPSAVL